MTSAAAELKAANPLKPPPLLLLNTTQQGHTYKDCNEIINDKGERLLRQGETCCRSHTQAAVLSRQRVAAHAGRHQQHRKPCM